MEPRIAVSTAFTNTVRPSNVEQIVSIFGQHRKTIEICVIKHAVALPVNDFIER